MKKNKGDIAWCFGHMSLADILQYKINDELDSGEFALVEIDEADERMVKDMNDHKYKLERVDTLRAIEPSVISKTAEDFSVMEKVVLEKPVK